MKTNTRKLVLNSILLAIGLLLHQLTPALGLPIQPDMALAMLFVIMVLNKDDYKTCLVAGIITGVFTALTTKFPAGQIPNIVDKTITVNIMFVFMYIVYRLPLIKKLTEKKKDTVVTTLLLPIGTLISGTSFLLSAKLIVGLPGSFTALFVVAVLPATVLNLVAGLFLFKVVKMTVSRTASA
ncbi:tryptophan transporter [Clostridioides mangenotii]|uniref:tryptophan transporter n=1 Tax=Metaclostridioides mangenotii TaxID=1540 RepID=UPI001C104BD3|nr:tryptophan transporter [Clostridioides mangenotii]MBU5306397.1 tryptophan transporter [Clostridioides mangenotii]MCR1953434.1 tryptophan transporter [Clostridioides mangenotii]